MTRHALGIRYDGRPWHGWQSQPDGRTVQDALEAALSRFADRPIRVSCAGRTDRGVHALGQVAHFDVDVNRTPAGWVRGVNALLPESIAVTWSAIVADDFDARFRAVARSYDYLLRVDPLRDPHWTGRAGWSHTPLDADAMRRAMRALEGTHDFSSFRSAECQAKSPVKTLTRAALDESGAFLRFGFTASAFVQHMVRNLIGALVAVGRGRRDPEWIGQLLEARDRRLGAPTFMPDGLYLVRVDYPAELALPAPPSFAGIHAGFA